MMSAPSPKLKAVLLAAVAAQAIAFGCGYGTLSAQEKPKDKLLVEANELIYNRGQDKVSAVGNAQLYYQGRTLEADRVIYDRKTKRVFAEGNARMTDSNGTKYFGDRFELTDDFKNGFIDSLRSESPDKQRFSAARGERINGETAVFDRGTYTACEPCKDDPSKPPLWQVRAARITHKSDEQTIYYEQATLEFWGLPVAYMPLFTSPDPTVTRKSGFLAPRLIFKKSLGYGISVPYFWAIAPNMDLEFAPTFLSKQGILGQVDWRHRLDSGIYTMRVAGIFQQDRTQFYPNPLGAGDKTFRGSFETTGHFYLNEKWKWGWDVAASTDRYFYTNYRIKTDSLANLYQKESISTLYLNGQGERSWFDLRGYYFRPLTTQDWQRQQAVVHPLIDYDRRFSNPYIGGEIQLNLNFASISRDAAFYRPIKTATEAASYIFSGTATDKKGSYGYSLYETCAIFTTAKCLLQGIGGSYSRASAALSWRRTFIDPLGQTWTPFASLRGDLAFVHLNLNRHNMGAGLYGNSQQSIFLPNNDEFSVRFMPTVGMEYRYPFIARFGNTTHQLEPIAQLVIRPNESKIGKLPNEDAHSLVFDDTVLFSANKFSGYDRVEGGVRINYGLQYTITGDSGGYANMLFGQSYHIAGRNSFGKTDMMNTGLDSGLETKQSDYVGRVTIAPNSMFSVTARGRFDEKNFAAKRIEVGAHLNAGPVTLGTTYARLAAQPAIGYPLRREGWLNTARVQLPNNWYLNGAVLFDMDRYLSDRANHIANPVLYPKYNNTPFRVAATTLGLGYKDECTDFSFSWTRTNSDLVTGTKTTGSLFLVRLELKNLGQTQYRGSAGLFDSTTGIQR
jgi:LPS-assembly protein